MAVHADERNFGGCVLIINLCVNANHNEPEVTGSSKIHSLWLLWTDVLALISSRHHTSFAVSLVL